jgi:hypothetical protein
VTGPSSSVAGRHGVALAHRPPLVFKGTLSECSPRAAEHEPPLVVSKFLGRFHFLIAFWVDLGGSEAVGELADTDGRRAAVRRILPRGRHRRGRLLHPLRLPRRPVPLRRRLALLPLGRLLIRGPCRLRCSGDLERPQAYRHAAVLLRAPPSRASRGRVEML